MDGSSFSKGANLETEWKHSWKGIEFLGSGGSVRSQLHGLSCGMRVLCPLTAVEAKASHGGASAHALSNQPTNSGSLKNNQINPAGQCRKREKSPGQPGFERRPQLLELSELDT